MLFCILSSTSLSLFSQTATTSLRGTIKDPSGALVPGARITLSNSANGQAFVAEANSSGQYVFPQIPPAKYTITATSQGFGTQSKVAELLVNQPATIDFSLTVHTETVTVDVSSTAQTLNTTDATLGAAVDNEQIQAMPLDGRDPISLLSLQPGALYLGESISLGDKTAAQNLDSRQGAVSGARSDQGNVTLDGVDDNDQINGFAFNGVLRSTLDSTQEFRVTTSNSNADAGRSSGAQVTLVTKSGTNQFHGNLFEYHRDTTTEANDWFNNNSGVPRAPLIRNQFGGNLGGPVMKNKAFFFFEYNGRRDNQGAQAERIVPLLVTITN